MSIKTKVFNAKNTVTAALISANTAMLIAMPTYAAGGSQIFTKVKSSLTDLWKQLNGIFTIACAAIFMICAFLYVFSKSPRKIEEAGDWMKRIIGIWLVVHILGWLLEYGQDLTKGGQDAIGK